jgi:hypothetical protein
VIYHFGKCVTISWDCDTSFGNKILGSLVFLLKKIPTQRGTERE